MQDHVECNEKLFLQKLEETIKKNKMPWSSDEILQELRDNNAITVFRKDGSFVITELHKFNNVTYLNIWLAFGKLEEIKELEKDILDYAKKNYCEYIQYTGRKGFIKIFEKLEITAYVMKRKL